jgi:hypothetical protein
MPFSSGTFSRVHDWTTDRDAGIKISASRTDAEFDGIATGLTATMLKDGSQTLTAMIPFTLGLSLPTDKKIQLRDSAIFINSSGDGQLDVVADTEIELTAPTVDVAASTAVTIATPSLIITDNTTDEPIVQIKNTHNGTTAGELRFVMDKGAAGADGDDLGTISFFGDDSGQNQTAFAKIVGEVSETDDTDEAGKLSFFVAESDGTNTALTAGLILEGEHTTDGEVDVTIGAGVASTTSVAGVLNVAGGAVFNEDSADVDFRVESNNFSHMLFVDGGNDKVMIGLETPDVFNGTTPPLQIEGTDNNKASLSITRNSNDNGQPLLILSKSRGTAVNSDTIVQDNDVIGEIVWLGADGNDRNSQVASISAEVDGTPGSNDMPGALVLRTTADGAATATERMRITSAGYVTKPSQVYAQAAGNGTRHNQTSANTEQSLDFAEVTDNTNSFNTSGGIFTAPVAGRYFVHYYASTKSNTSYIQLLVKHNSTIVATDYNELPNNSNDWSAQQVTVILNMSANDTVQPFMVSGGTNAFALELYYRGASIYLLG